jgi:hypothetical protein
LFERLKKQLAARARASSILAPLAFLVLSFLAVACFLAFLEILVPAAAALATAGIGVFLMIVVFLIMRVATRRTRTGSAKRDADPRDPFESLLGERSDPFLRGWIQANPDKAVIAGVLLGAAAGYSKSVRRIFLDSFRRYADFNARARANRDHSRRY